MSRYAGFIVIHPDGDPIFECVGRNRQEAIKQCLEFNPEKGYRCMRFKIKIPRQKESKE